MKRIFPLFFLRTNLYICVVYLENLKVTIRPWLYKLKFVMWKWNWRLWLSIQILCKDHCNILTYSFLRNVVETRPGTLLRKDSCYVFSCSLFRTAILFNICQHQFFPTYSLMKLVLPNVIYQKVFIKVCCKGIPNTADKFFYYK